MKQNLSKLATKLSRHDDFYLERIEKGVKYGVSEEILRGEFQRYVSFVLDVAFGFVVFFFFFFYKYGCVCINYW